MFLSIFITEIKINDVSSKQTGADLNFVVVLWVPPFSDGHTYYVIESIRYWDI